MANPLDRLMVPEGPSIYYDPTFRVTLESHLTYFRTSGVSVMQVIDPKDAYRFEGDLYGLLAKLSISKEQHWLIMRVNDFTSPQDASDDLKHLLIPDPASVERIRQRYMISQNL